MNAATKQSIISAVIRYAVDRLATAKSSVEQKRIAKKTVRDIRAIKNEKI